MLMFWFVLYSRCMFASTNKNIMETIYNLTKEECKTLCENYDTEKLAFILWNRGIVKTLESGIKRAIKIKNFITI